MKILEAQGISKEFPGCKALDNVSLHLYEGEVLSVVGENGAGKSTLMKILAGIYHADQGKILLDDEQVSIESPKVALHLGISLIHQELSVVPDITVAENLFMGRELRKYGLFLDKKEMEKRSDEILRRVKAPFDSQSYPGRLSIADQQVLEIAKAVGQSSRILIMDEPTASLSNTEMDNLFALINDLKRENISIIYISHRLKEIVEISDRVMVLRDGKHVATLNSRDEMNEELIVSHMVGRTLTDYYGGAGEANLGTDVLFSAREMSTSDMDNSISFDLYRGEILSLTGLVGAGRTEIAQMLFGLGKNISGTCFLEGQKVDIHSPAAAMKHGIGFLSEDRKGSGLFLDMSAADNISINILREIASLGFLRGSATREFAKPYIKDLRISLSSPQVTALSLSGGNQQKLLLSRWLSIRPKVLILDEPTRGVDVGAKSEIYKIIVGLVRERQTSVIFISSELPEVIGLAHRVLVVRDGQIVTEIRNRSEITQDNIMQYAAGVKSADYFYQGGGTGE